MNRGEASRPRPPAVSCSENWQGAVFRGLNELLGVFSDFNFMDAISGQVIVGDLPAQTVARRVKRG